MAHAEDRVTGSLLGAGPDIVSGMARDDFSPATIRALERRTGGRCSNPECRQPTSGPGDGPLNVTSVGTAAHVTAASPQGPRYDPSLTPQQRQSVENGIWLCARCGRLIDASAARFPVELLRTWKEQAEIQALDAIGGAEGIGFSGEPGVVLERILEGHTNYVWDVAITPDGRRVLSASNDNTVAVWDSHSGALVGRLGPHRTMVHSVAVSPQSDGIAAGQQDGRVNVWDLPTSQQISNWFHGAADAKIAYLSPNAAITGGSDGFLRLWDVPSGTVLGEVAAHLGPVLKVCCADDTLVSVSADRSIAIWDSDTFELQRRLSGHLGEVNSVAISCMHDRLLTASEDRTVRLWSIASGDCLAVLEGHSDVVWRVALSSDCRRAASGSADNSVFLWDLESFQLVQRIEHPDCVAAVAFSPVDDRLAVGCDDHCVYLYRLNEPADAA